MIGSHCWRAVVVSCVGGLSLLACSSASDGTESTDDVGDSSVRDSAAPNDEITTETLDPNAVHMLVGAYANGASCFHGALTRWTEPKGGYAALGCDTDYETLQIDAESGRVLYRGGAAMDARWREFRADTRWDWTSDDYPTQGERNDIEVPTPECERAAFQLSVRPEGGYLYQCEANGMVFTSDGDALGPLVGNWLRVSFGAVALVLRDGQRLFVVQLISGHEQEVHGLPVPLTVEAHRAAHDGFRIVANRIQSISAQVVIAPELWLVSRTGGSSLMGIYPSLPPDASAYTGSVLDADDSLVGRADVPRPTPQHALIRRRATATGREGLIEVLYGLGDSLPADRVEDGFILKLITGP